MLREGNRLQLTTRLQAIQLYPYHSGLKAHTLVNGFPVRPFSDMLWSLRISPFGKSDDLTGLSPTCGASNTITYATMRRTMELPASRTMTLIINLLIGWVFTVVYVDMKNKKTWLFRAISSVTFLLQQQVGVQRMFINQPNLADFDPGQPVIPKHTSQILETVSAEMGS